MASTKTAQELDAEARFRTYKDALIRIYGRGPLDSDMIEQFGIEAVGPRGAESPVRSGSGPP